MWSMERFGRQSGQSLNSLWQRFSNSSVTAKGRLLFPAGSFPYLFLFGSLSLAGIISWGRIRQKQRSSLKTAPDVDIARYTGTWFEIARLPAPEEKGAVNMYHLLNSMEDSSDIYLLNIIYMLTQNIHYS